MSFDINSYQDPVKFKELGRPKCPNADCRSTNLDVSLSEHLFGPCNGQYEVVFCRDCMTLLAAHPIAIMNVMKGIPEQEKIPYPQV
ncbi:hypothetical protein C1X72_02045 [Pseudomonas sp. FW306-2-2C-D06B]|uniref:hypothetical protein n=1 Tax=unclassified Pseudomonas TaxID=196821 RepID=UPI0007614FBB|nr:MULTISPECIES: hypothetical protein [unclassified Pseudomonas]PMY82849.1 hypothetical protein C1X72_02045 [Pseudomonas sp. FW306-2-2C-D06B]